MYRARVYYSTVFSECIKRADLIEQFGSENWSIPFVQIYNFSWLTTDRYLRPLKIYLWWVLSPHRQAWRDPRCLLYIDLEGSKASDCCKSWEFIDLYWTWSIGSALLERTVWKDRFLFKELFDQFFSSFELRSWARAGLTLEIILTLYCAAELEVGTSQVEKSDVKISHRFVYVHIRS